MRILDNLWHFMFFRVNRSIGKMATQINNRLEKWSVVQMFIRTNGRQMSSCTNGQCEQRQVSQKGCRTYDLLDKWHIVQVTGQTKGPQAND